MLGPKRGLKINLPALASIKGHYTSLWEEADLDLLTQIVAQNKIGIRFCISFELNSVLIEIYRVKVNLPRTFCVVHRLPVIDQGIYFFVGIVGQSYPLIKAF